MKYKLHFCVFALALLYSQLSTAADPYNAYLWNRQNVEMETGRTDQRDWYEWWYYKVVDPKTREAFFFTYAVVNPWDTHGRLGGTKAGVQIGDFRQRILVEKNYPLAEFNASYSKTHVTIGENTATDKRIRGHVTQNGHDVEWDMAIRKDWRFSAMGWAMGMQEISGIYWYPAQASAFMTGWIRFDGRTVKFDQAPGYQDRNWGRNFPKWWTWLTSNHFKNSPGTVLAAGGGKPKVLNSVYLFSGLCIGLRHQGQEYIFRTTDMDFVNFNIQWGIWNVLAENKRGQRIEISAYAPPSDFMMLPFQSPRGPVFYDYEALLGKMTVKIFERKHPAAPWRTIAVLETDAAGIEWGSPQALQSSGGYNFANLFSTVTQLQ